MLASKSSLPNMSYGQTSETTLHQLTLCCHVFVLYCHAFVLCRNAFVLCRGGGLLTRLIYARFQELVHSGHMHALPTLLPGQWHAGLKAVKSILRRIFIKRDRAWKSYTKVTNNAIDINSK